MISIVRSLHESDTILISLLASQEQVTDSTNRVFHPHVLVFFLPAQLESDTIYPDFVTRLQRSLQHIQRSKLNENLKEQPFLERMAYF